MRIGRFINRLLAPLGLKLSRIDRGPIPYQRSHSIDSNEISDLNQNARKVLNVVEYTKTTGSSYSAAEFEGAYHTIRLDGRSFPGQRDPRERLKGVPFDFSGRSVLDVGCNQGGMLFAISDYIAYGIGIDYDFRMINAANRIRSYTEQRNVDFYVFDLQKENLDLIQDLIPSNRVDVVFLLSVCMWLENWRDVIREMSKLSNNMLFESNGSPAQQEEQELELAATYAAITKIRDRSTDDPKQASRRLFFCSDPKSCYNATE